MSVPYSTTTPWPLSNGDGKKTIYVKFRDAAGNISPTYSSSITLDTVSPSLDSPSAWESRLALVHTRLSLMAATKSP
jgi:hypothetical protein